MNMMRMGEKKTRKRNKIKPRKNSSFGYPTILFIYDMEVDCFPVSESSENKLDLS